MKERDKCINFIKNQLMLNLGKLSFSYVTISCVCASSKLIGDAREMFHKHVNLKSVGLLNKFSKSIE